MFEETNPVSFQDVTKNSSVFDVDNNLLGKKSDLDFNDNYSSSGFDLASTFEYNGNQYAWGEYSVQTGDTLGLLAEQTLDDGSAFGFIAAYNGIEDPNQIFTGQEIMLPMEVYTLEDQPSINQESTGVYIVQQGDTLAQIAESIVGNASAYKDIAAYNGISNPNFIFEGQELAIPIMDAKPIGQSYDDSEILLPSLKQNSGGSNLEIVQTAANNLELSNQKFDFHFTPDQIELPSSDKSEAVEKVVANNFGQAFFVGNTLTDDPAKGSQYQQAYEAVKDATNAIENVLDPLGHAGLAQELSYRVEHDFFQRKPKAKMVFELSFRDFGMHKSKTGNNSTSHTFLNLVYKEGLSGKNNKGIIRDYKIGEKGLRLDYGFNKNSGGATNWHWNQVGSADLGFGDHSIPSKGAVNFGKTVKNFVKPVGRAASVLSTGLDALSIGNEAIQSVETGDWTNTGKKVASTGAGWAGSYATAKTFGMLGATLGVAGGPVGVAAGGLIGATVGGAVGGYVFSEAAEETFDFFFS